MLGEVLVNSNLLAAGGPRQDEQASPCCLLWGVVGAGDPRCLLQAGQPPHTCRTRTGNWPRFCKSRCAQRHVRGGGRGLEPATRLPALRAAPPTSPAHRNPALHVAAGAGLPHAEPWRRGWGVSARSGTPTAACKGAGVCWRRAWRLPPAAQRCSGQRARAL